MGGYIHPNDGLPYGVTHKDMEISNLHAEVERLKRTIFNLERVIANQRTKNKSHKQDQIPKWNEK